MASDAPALHLSIFLIGGLPPLRGLHLHLFYVGTSLSLNDCVSLLDFAVCWVELDDFANLLIDAVLSHELVLRHFALLLGFRVFLSVAEGECWMWVCPACIHTPKTPLCLYPLPLCRSSLLCCVRLCVHKSLEKSWGARSMRPWPLYHHHDYCFWDMNEERLTLDLPLGRRAVLTPPSPSNRP